MVHAAGDSWNPEIFFKNRQESQRGREIPWPTPWDVQTSRNSLGIPWCLGPCHGDHFSHRFLWSSEVNGRAQRRANYLHTIRGSPWKLGLLPKHCKSQLVNWHSAALQNVGFLVGFCTVSEETVQKPTRKLTFCKAAEWEFSSWLLQCFGSWITTHWESINK